MPKNENRARKQAPWSGFVIARRLLVGGAWVLDSTVVDNLSFQDKSVSSYMLLQAQHLSLLDI